MLGEGQGVDYYSGIKFANGYVFKEGDLGTESLGYDGQKYTVDKDGEGHFKNDWIKIVNTTKPTTKGTKNGEVRNKYWGWDAEAPFGGAWTWVGPTYN